MLSKTVRMVLLGDDKSAVKALGNVRKGFLDGIKGAEGFAGKAKFAGVALAGIAAAAVAAGAAIVVKFGQDSINTFKRVAGEVAGLKRVTGMTTEDASRLGFALKQSGVDAAVGTKSFTILGKNLATSAGDAKKHAAMTKLLGFAYTDAHGKVKPMAQLMPKLADKFASMPDGAEKTALAMKLFGKSGTAMLPFLNKGSKGLAELADKSDKFGNTLNDKQLDALKKSKQAQRDWDAALQGLQVTLGANLLPAVTDFATMLNSVAVPAFQATAEWVTKNQGTFQALGNMMRWVWNNVLLPVVKFVIWGNAQWAQGLGIILEAMGRLTGNKDLETFGKGIQQAATDTQAWANSLQAIPDTVAPTIDAKTEQAKTELGLVDKKIKGLKDKIVTAKAKGDDKGLKDLERKLKAAEKKRHLITATIRGRLDPGTDVIKLNISRGGKTGVMRLAATGGRVPPGWVGTGEYGRELAFASRGAFIATKAESDRLLAGGNLAGKSSRTSAVNNNFHIDIRVAPGADRVAMARELRTMLLELKSILGGKELGIA